MSTIDHRTEVLAGDLATGRSTLGGELNPQNILTHFVLNSKDFPNINMDSVPTESIPSKKDISDAFKNYAKDVLEKAQHSVYWLSVYPDARKLPDHKAEILAEAGVKAGTLYKEAQTALQRAEKVLTDDALYAQVVYEILTCRRGHCSEKAVDSSPAPVEKLLPHLPATIRTGITPR